MNSLGYRIDRTKEWMSVIIVEGRPQPTSNVIKPRHVVYLLLCQNHAELKLFQDMKRNGSVWYGRKWTGRNSFLFNLGFTLRWSVILRRSDGLPQRQLLLPTQRLAARRFFTAPKIRAAGKPHGYNGGWYYDSRTITHCKFCSLHSGGLCLRKLG